MSEPATTSPTLTPPTASAVTNPAPEARAHPDRQPSRLVRWLSAVRHRFLAATRLSLRSVCAASAALGEYDYHNHRDDADGAPWHVEGGRTCKRCGTRFRL